MASTLNNPTLPYVTAVINASTTFTFSEVTDSVDDAYSGTGNCGDRNYAFNYNNAGTIIAVDWASVTEDTPSADTHTVTLTPTNSGLV